MFVTAYERLESSKKVAVCFDDRIHVKMYPADARILQLKLGAEITEEEYQHILHGVLGKRAAKRAMHLLERMDRTEHQLREKLKQNDYPPEAVEDAVSYVKRYHYIDDARYAGNYTRCHMQDRSRQRITMDLMRKGIAKDVIIEALDKDYISDEREQIAVLLRKKRFPKIQGDAGEFRRIYQFLLRRGFHNQDIFAVMKNTEQDGLNYEKM